MRESPAAARAFEEYYDLGDDRSLRALAQKRLEEIRVRQGDARDTPKEATLVRQFQDWSAKHGWQGRVIARDREKAEAKRKKRDADIEEMNNRHALIGTTQQVKAIKQIKMLIEQQKFGALASVQLLKFATDLERLARGVPTEQVALTGKDGGPIEADVIVETFWGRGTDPRKSKEEGKSEETSQQVEIQSNEQLEVTIEIDEEDSNQ